MNKEKQFICIKCPKGCMITSIYELHSKKIISIEGNSCKRGFDYVQKEITNPKRMLTSTVRISNAIVRMLPVATSCEIPKEKIFLVMQELNKIMVKSPIKYKDIIIKNVCDTGADIIAQANM